MQRKFSIVMLASVLAGAWITLGQTPDSSPRELMTDRRTATAPATSAPGAIGAVSEADRKQFTTRLELLGGNDLEGRLTLARWARDHGLWPEAISLAQAALSRDPGNKVAYLILQQADDARPLPEEPKVELSLKAQFEALFNHSFQTWHSKHFLFCYDTTTSFAAQRGAAMEQVYDAFQFYFNMSKLQPQFLKHRLVVVLFNDRDEYLDYLERASHADMSWSEGVYSPQLNLSTFFDASTGLTAASFNKEEIALRAKLDALNKQIAAANAQNQKDVAGQLILERNRTGEALAKDDNRKGLLVRLNNLSTTMHEGAHQVAFNTGIQMRGVDYPRWFSEGLACCFEQDDSSGRRGPAILNPNRIADIKELMKKNALLPVEKLITQSQEEAMSGDRIIVYAEGWALFHFLYKTDRSGLEKYLLSFQTPPLPLDTGPELRRKMFTDAFGDNLDEINRKFMAYVRSLPTPIVLSQPR